MPLNLNQLQSQIRSKESFMKAYIGRDAVKVVNYCKEIEKLLKDNPDALKDDAGKKFEKEKLDWVAKTLEEAAESAALAELKKIQGQVRSKQSFMGSYIQRGDAKSVEKYCKEITALLDSKPDAFVGDAGKTYEKEIRDFVSETMVKVGDMAAMAELKKYTNEIDGQMRWLDSAIKGKRLKDIPKYRNSIVDLVNKHGENLMKTGAGMRYLEGIRKTLEEAESTGNAIILAAEAKALIDSVQRELRWVSTHLKRGATDDGLKAWERAQVAAKPLFEDPKWVLNPLEDITKFKETYAKEEAAVEDTVAKQRLAAEIGGAARQLESMAYWLKNYLDQKNPHVAMKKGEEVRKAFDSFVSKYENEAQAKPAIKNVSALLERVDTEIMPLLEKEEIASISRQADSAMKWLETYLGQKDVDKCIEYREQVEALTAPMRESPFADHEESKACIAKVDAICGSLEEQLGEIIAEKDIRRLGDQLRREMKWLDTYLNMKDATRAQVYREKVEEALGPLRRYEDKPDAKATIDECDTLLGRVETEMGEILAEQEILGLSRKLTSSLSFFESCLQNKDVDGVIKRREKVVQATMPLKSKYSSHIKAKDILERADKDLSQCEAEVGGMIADRAIAAVDRKMRTAISFAKSAVERKDARAGLSQLQTLSMLVHPLAVEYPDNEKAQALIKEVDDITGELGPILGSAMEGKDAEKHIKNVAPAVDKAAECVDANDLVGAGRLLKTANDAAKPLRTRFSFQPTVKELLTKLDGLNIQVFGGIPADEGGAPHIDIDWKLPVAEQDVLKKINEQLDLINHTLGATREYYETTVCLDGTQRTFETTWEHLNGMMGPGSRNDPSKSLDNIKVLLDELEKVHPHTEDNPNPVFKLCQDADPELRALVKERLEFYQPRCQYALEMYGAIKYFTAAQEHREGYCMDEKNKDAPFGWEKVLELLQKDLRFAEAAMKTLPEDHDEADAHMKLVEAMQVEAENKLKDGCVKWFKATALDDAWYKADQYEKLLQSKYPNSEEFQAMGILKAKIKADQEAKAKAAKEEYERQQREKEELREKQREEWREKGLYPFKAGGEVAVGNMKWRYTYDEEKKKGMLKQGQFEYTWEATVDSMYLDGKDDEQGYMWGDDEQMKVCSQLTWVPSGSNFFSKTWLYYKFNQKDNAYEDGEDYRWKLDGNKLTLSGSPKLDFDGKFVADNVSFSGSVPPQVVVFCAVIGPVLQQLPGWVKARQAYNEAYLKEKERRDECYKIVNEDCGGCNYAGQKTGCYNCGYNLCRHCVPAGMPGNCPSCDSWCDYYSTEPNDNWKEKIGEELGFDPR